MFEYIKGNAEYISSVGTERMPTESDLAPTTLPLPNHPIQLHQCKHISHVSTRPTTKLNRN